MPAPLTMPVARTGTPSISTATEAALGAVSVVMMARAASAQPSPRAHATAASIPWRITSMGRNSPMTPVEKGSTWSARTPTAAPRWAQEARASARPRSPVAALALPLFTTSAPGRAQMLPGDQHRGGSERIPREDAADGTPGFQ